MALKYANQIKTVQGNKDLELTPRDNESILVKNIFVDTPANNYAAIRIAQTNVGYWRVGGTLGNHLAPLVQDESNMSLFGKLVNKEIFRPYPVGNGETFSIDNVAQASATQIVIYDIYDANDITPDMPNGSKHKELDYISYGRNTASISDGDNEYNVLQNTGQFPKFPWKSEVPQNREFIIHGICFSDFGCTSGSASNKHTTQYLKFYRDQIFLFDIEDLNGLPYIGSAPASDGDNIGTNISIGGNYDDVDERPFYLFPEPIIFTPGENLDIYLETSVDAGSANLAVTDTELGLIMTQVIS